MPRTFVVGGHLQKSWGGQSWLQPPFRRLFGPQTPVDSPKEPAKSRPQRGPRARFPAPRLMQNPNLEKVRGIEPILAASRLSGGSPQVRSLQRPDTTLWMRHY